MPVTIDRLQDERGAHECARMMSSSEPWLTLGRTYADCLKAVEDSSREVYVAREEGQIRGLVILCMSGAFVGYIQTVCVDAQYRGQGLGTDLIHYAEDRIFRQGPNAFMCVSSFNQDARRLYLRLGYQVVGELRDYVVRGHSEILLRKSLGPIKDWKP